MAALSAKALLLLLLGSVAALQAPCTLSRRAATHRAALGFAELAEQSSLAPADKSRITVLSDADAVGAESLDLGRERVRRIHECCRGSSDDGRIRERE